MASIFPLFLLFSSLTLLSIAGAQERAPHGLAKENPMAFSPTAYDFFHPNSKNPVAKDPCVASKCSPLPIAAHVEATEGHESRFSGSQNGKTRVGAGGIAGIVFGLGFVVFLAMGVYYVIVARRTKMTRANTVKPDV
ncbi:hypothetical protein RchiOBHm_Chr5g0059071 [Rosa chinensis]|uniref:Transmembrane protein n=1 Tax=Rosa chinensis TaxID=74649 RepID=A0A2P6QHB4_ROSCH|nr:uncharacterized protein LOC112167335 [Rosa chinensis]PRQ33568.1 hypothetical protein RchiOBHm_Chr5g0059071 [Rosa chinensis]